MTTYPSETSLIGQAKATAKRKARKWYALSAVGVVFAGGAAFAAVQLFGFGSIDAGATTMKNLIVGNDAHLTKSLVPGATAGAAGSVGNPNDFDVKVTAVVVKDAGLSVTGTGCSTSLHLKGTHGDFGPAGVGYRIDITPVTIAAGQTVNVAVPEVVSQDANATALCGFHADYSVIATVGN